ncbi:dynein axonemal assembly factor 1 homolog isoform X1 [Linepithema humile]|uniref:dynein axonemal assembly factor 1 homolog isoform X1 n=1 Tax=Linepithema humile TaxID=83485 RepID=UPI00351EEE5F
MNTLKSDNNALEDPHGLSLGSLTENKNQASTSISYTSSESEHKDYSAEFKVPDSKENPIAKTQFKVENCENLCGSVKIEATNDVNEDNAPTVSLNYDQMFDLNHLSYFNSSIANDVISMCKDFEYNNEIICGEDFEDSEKTIQEEFLADDQCTDLLNDLIKLQGKVHEMKHDKEKSADSKTLLSSVNVEDNNDKIARLVIDSHIDENSDNTTCKNIEKDIKDEEEELEQELALCIDIKNPYQAKLNIKNTTISIVESSDCYINKNKNYFKNDIDLLKYTEENPEYTLNTASAEENSLETTLTEIKEMNKLLENLISTTDLTDMCDDGQHDLAEEQMIGALSAKVESDHDDVMKKIIESCSNISADLQQHSLIRENSDLKRSSSEYEMRKSRAYEVFPRRVTSETAISKEDILKTIEEAKKILTDNPYCDTTETSANQTTEIYDKDNTPERSAEEVKDDEEHETVNDKERNFIEDDNIQINSANIEAERIVELESDIVEKNLNKLIKITCLQRPKSFTEIQETLEKIAEEKRKIEDRKKESLETLSKKFDEIDKIVADHDVSCVSDDICDFKILKDVADDSDSLDEFQGDLENYETPLTKSEICEKLKIEELEKKLTDEIEEHKKLMNEYKKIISTDLEEIQKATLEWKSTQDCNDEDIYEETKNESTDEEKIDDEDSNEISEIIADTTEIKIDSEFDDFFSDDFKKPEEIYIKGKVYDFDEKKHGVRMTEELIRKHCKEHKLYQTPYLNDVLYLHYKGFSFIESLEKYTGLKCLWLESNGILEIANLENQRELKCLYLHHNLINKIENLDCLTKLDTLNLSHNTIRRIENLGSLKFLNNLNLSHNYLRETADIEHLRLLHALSILDISHNRIDTCDIVDILGDMKSLRVVTLTGNPVLKQIKMYRKTMILKCKTLQYLDDRPVFPRDRACAEAWMRGGVDEEMAERNRWIQAEQKRINDSVTALINKRKLRKPVETSEKEAADKKKEEEEEEAKQDEEIATKSGARTAMRSSGLLHLERKKKSEERSSLGSYASSSSSSSSSDDEPASDEENKRARQKGGEESDGKRPMAEEERKVFDENNEKLLLPWETKTRNEVQPRMLIEEISESEQYIPDNAERKSLKKLTSDNYKNVHNSPDDCVDDSEIVDYETIEKRKANSQESIDDNNKINGCKNEKASYTCSISCDTSDLRQVLETQKPTNTVSSVRDNVSRKNINSYQKKSKEYPFGSKLSSIREEMKEFCDSMNRFVDENKIVFKNGEVEGFWSGRQMVDENLQTDFVNDSQIQETESEISANKEDKLRWSCTKERKLKVKEIKKQEDRAAENKVETDQLFTELKYQKNVQKMCESIISNDLIPLEKMSVSKQSEKKSISNIINVIDSDFDEQFDNIVEADDKSAKFEILGDKFNNLLYESAEEKKNVDESDDDSYKTATSLQEDLQILENNQESPEIFIFSNKKNNCDKTVDSIKNENIDDLISCKKTILDEEQNDIICEDKKTDNKVKKSSIKIEMSNSKGELSAVIEKSNSQIESLVQTMDRLSLEGTGLSSRLIGKRTREAEDVEVSNKKSFLIEEMNPGRKSEERKPRSQISERCRQHLIQETKKFTKKASPLIDKCITNLMKNAENTDELSQYRKYDRRSLGEYLPSNFTSKMNVNTPAGDSGERNNDCNKYSNKSNDMTSEHSAKQEFMAQQTIDLESTTSTNASDIQLLANLLRQPEGSYKSKSPAANADVSLYKEFCNHLHELESTKKLLIKPNLVMDNQESKEELSDHKLLQTTERSVQKSVKPFIEVISASAASKKSEQNLGQIEKKSYSFQNISDYHQTEAAFQRLSEEMTSDETSDDPEKHINQEDVVNLKKETTIEIFSASDTLENIECEKKCVSPNKKHETATRNMKKSIEMQIAQEK